MSDLLDQPVFSQGSNVRFGEMTLPMVRERGQELQSAVGWGPTARVAPVAAAWRELATRMEQVGAETVADLPDADLQPLAQRLWVVPPGGSLLG